MLRALAAVSLMLAASPAAAQEREQSIAEVASDLAYGFCPLFLAQQFELTSPELAKRGFGTNIEKQPHPRVGEIQMVTAKRADGELSFGGAAGKTCSVVIGGPNRASAMSRLHETMPYMGLKFEKIANPAPDLPGIRSETFKAPIEGQFLYVQLLQAGGPTPAVIAQLFAMEK